MTTQPLGDVADLVRGVAFAKEDKRHEYADGLIACLRTTNVQRTVEWDDLWFVPQAVAKRDDQIVRSGDILISTANSYELVGKVAMVTSMPHRSTLGAFISLIRPKPHILASYLYYQLSSHPVQAAIRACASTTTNISNVSTKKLAAIDVTVADEATQAATVAYLDEQLSRLDASVAALLRAQANLKRYRASVLQAACEGRLVPTEAELARAEGRTFETGAELLQRILAERRTVWVGSYKEPSVVEPKELPALAEGWTWATAEQLCDFITKGTTPSASKLSADGEVQFLKVYNLNDSGVLNHQHKPAFVARATHEGELARSKSLPGDVLMNIVGPPLGQVVVVPPELTEANINQAIARFRCLLPAMSGYLVQVLLTKEVLDRSIRKAKTTVGQVNLTLEICREIAIPLPPLAEQHRIVAEADRRLSLIRGAEAQVAANLARAKRLRQSILQTAFAQPGSAGQ